MTLVALFQSSSPIRPKNSKKKLVKSRFCYYRFSSLVTAVYLRLVLLYVRSSKEVKVLKLTKVPLQKNGSMVYVASLFNWDIL